MTKKTLNKTLDERGVLEIFDAFYEDVKKNKQGGGCGTTPIYTRRIKASKDDKGFDAKVLNYKWSTKTYNSFHWMTDKKLTKSFKEMIEDIFSLKAKSVNCHIADDDGLGAYGWITIKPSRTVVRGDVDEQGVPALHSKFAYETTLEAECPLEGGKGKLNALMCNQS